MGSQVGGATLGEEGWQGSGWGREGVSRREEERKRRDGQELVLHERPVPSGFLSP